MDFFHSVTQETLLDQLFVFHATLVLFHVMAELAKDDSEGRNAGSLFTQNESLRSVTRSRMEPHQEEQFHLRAQPALSN
jgi:hypothetical protein